MNKFRHYIFLHTVILIFTGCGFIGNKIPDFIEQSKNYGYKGRFYTPDNFFIKQALNYYNVKSLVVYNDTKTRAVLLQAFSKSQTQHFKTIIRKFMSQISRINKQYAVKVQEENIIINKDLFFLYEGQKPEKMISIITNY
jgi:hypothetical protein